MNSLRRTSDRYKYIVEEMARLKKYGANRKVKYERNLQLYEDTPGLTLDDIRNSIPVGYHKYSRMDTTPDINYNVSKQCVDNLTSQIASKKVRPFFNLVRGSYKDVKVTREAQRFFDQFFDYSNVAKEVEQCFRCCAIFDTGWIYIHPKEKTIRNVLPWQVYIDPAEETYNKLTKIYYERKQYPVSLLESLPSSYGKVTSVTLGEFYDLKEKIHAVIFDDGTVYSEEWNAPVLPFLYIHFSEPILGNSSSSIVDVLLSLQLQLNSLMNNVKDASQTTPANTIFIPRGTGISAKKLGNGIGQVIEYDLPDNMATSPVTIATPPFADPQHMNVFEELKQTAFESVGLNQLSNSGLKPSGLNSGVALQTIENIESDRQEVAFNTVIRLYSDIARTTMKVFNPNETVLPEDVFRSKVTWADIVEEERKMKIQFSGADAISKDPATKAQVLSMYAQSGIVPAEMISQLLEIPDVDTSYSYSGNQWNAVQTVIDRCIYEDIYEIPIFVNYLSVQKEILNTQLMLFAADPENNVGDINKLTKLFQVAFKANNDVAAVLAPEEEDA